MDAKARMLDTRRIEIDFFPGFEVDARCRVFAAGSHVPLPSEWPYVTLREGDIALSLNAPEICALSFLGPDGCEAVFRELYGENVFKGHGRIKEIALDRGISQWAVMAAARRHHEAFRVSSILSDLRAGRYGSCMWLHRVERTRIDFYDVYEVVMGSPGQRLFDHAITLGGIAYRFRRIGEIPLAQCGDEVSFSYRLDRQGGRFVVQSSLVRSFRI